MPSISENLKSPREIKNICCIGAGYVGGPTCSVIAYKCPHINVTIVDQCHSRIMAWNSDVLPIYEPDLEHIVKQCRGRNLTFSTDQDSAIRSADLIFVSVNTPTKQSGIGKGFAADLGYLETATRQIARVATKDTIVVEKSTVPCRTACSIAKILAANSSPEVQFDILSNPEFLAEGSAIRDLLNPDRVLIGCMDTPEGHKAAASLVSIYANWIPTERVLTTRVWSSELSKLAANALLAQRISSINSLSAICELTGANIEEVSNACGLDSRIGRLFLNASIGFGGSCFQKDILNLVYMSESLHLQEVADYWRQVLEMNDYQKRRFTERIMRSLFSTLNGKRLAIFGFSFKKDTSDTRESPALSIVNYFLQERGAEIVIYDPKVPETQIWDDLTRVSGEPLGRIQEQVSLSSSCLEAATMADAIVILTDWDEFRDSVLDYQEVYNVMRKPSFVFDGRLLIDVAKLRRIGFKVESIGKGEGQERINF